MAFLRRRKDGTIRIQYWDSARGKKRDIPRHKIKHLDTLSDEEIERWIAAWEAANTIKVERVLERHLSEEDEAASFFEAFINRYALMNKISEVTVKEDRRRFFKHIVPVIVGKYQRKDVRTWSTVLPQLVPELMAAQNLAEEQIRKCVFLMMRFGKYLASMGIIQQPWVVELPSAPTRDTPLEVSLVPEQVLAFAKSCGDRRVKLMALLGFFAGLRPNETFALSKEDFLTGDTAVQKSPTYSRFQNISLGTKLTIRLSRMIANDGSVKAKTKGQNLRERSRKKADSIPKFEYVTVWSVEAAKALSELLREMENGPLFSQGRKRLFDVWQREGFLGLKVTLHDLRRASGFYLGRVIDAPVTLIQDHLRHENINTSALYMRRPAEEAGDIGKQNFDDVV
jgi:integrase